MIGIVVGSGAPLYPSNLVDLIVNFIQDAQDLLLKENSEEMRAREHGYAGYLRVESRRGVHNPLVLAYMRKHFYQYRGIVELCSTLETTVKKYDEKWWDFLQEHYNPREVAGDQRRISNSGDLLYLCRFIPESEVARAIKSL